MAPTTNKVGCCLTLEIQRKRRREREGARWVKGMRKIYRTTERAQRESRERERADGERAERERADIESR